MTEYKPERFTIAITKEVRDTDLMKRLKRLAKGRKRSMSFVVVEALQEYLKRHSEDTESVD